MQLEWNTLSATYVTTTTLSLGYLTQSIARDGMRVWNHYAPEHYTLSQQQQTKIAIISQILGTTLSAYLVIYNESQQIDDFNRDIKLIKIRQAETENLMNARNYCISKENMQEMKEGFFYQCYSYLFEEILLRNKFLNYLATKLI